MADWTKPTVSSTYANYTNEITGLLASLAKGMDSALVSDTNVLANTIRWNSSTKLWERYNGATWAALTATYGINISGSAGSAPWSGISGKPTTVGGYGITDMASQSVAYAVNASNLTGAGTVAANVTGVTQTTGDNSTKLATTAYADGMRVTLGTPAATTSGTSIDYTGLPSGIKRIVMMFAGVSTNSASGSDLLIRIGPSSGLDTTGYVSGSTSTYAGSVPDSRSNTTGFDILTGGSPAFTYHGAVTLHLVDASTNTWVASGVLFDPDGTKTIQVAGSKSLAGALNKISLTTKAPSTDTFDAGKINIAYEF